MKTIIKYLLSTSVLALVFSQIFSTKVYAQANDPVIMTVNGKNVPRSEFEYSFNKNNSDGVIDKKNLSEYVKLFEAFKLKVAAAESARIDTMASVRQELANYKCQIVYPTIIDSGYIERTAYETYKQTAERYGNDDLLAASHILVLMRQDATAEQQAAAKVRIDSIYAALKAGADFAELAKQCSDDKGSAVRGGDLGQFGKGMMIPDFEKAAYALQAGEMSEPVKTTVGWHIIKVADRHPFESYEFHHENILKFLKQRGIEDAASKYYVDSIAKQTGKNADEIIEDLYTNLIENDADLRNLSKEYYDGTLMYEMVKNTIWEPASKDEEGLQKYFKKHKKQYAWDAPRYKGLVIYAVDDATLSKAQAIAKKIKGDDTYAIASAIVKEFNTDSIKNVRVEHGVFKKGDSQNVDVKVYGEKGELKPRKGYPSVGVFGTLLKAPKSYVDVKNQVVVDYQQLKEQEWVEELRHKYTITVNEDILKTVNKHE